MALATVSRPKKKRLNREELDAAEKVLRKKYRHIEPGTLKNFSVKGVHHGKRTVTINCAASGCTNTRRIATSDLAQVRYCTDCTLERRAARRRKNPRNANSEHRPRQGPGSQDPGTAHLFYQGHTLSSP